MNHPPATAAPRYAHIVIVVLENHANSEIIGNPDAPFLNTLGQQGLRLTQSYAIAHPSQPNYLALFSGSTQHVADDTCPVTRHGGNLASALLAAGDTFVGYSEGLPAAGYSGCRARAYLRACNPWVDFADVPASVNQPLRAFPREYTHLPTVAFVIPNLDHDMRSGTIAQADHWLSAHLARYATWSLSHRSLLIITWDEDDRRHHNHIPTILYGYGLLAGTDSQHVTHYTLLRTIEDDYGLPHLGHTAHTAPLTGTWQP